MIFKLRRKRVPSWDINSNSPKKRQRNLFAQWASALFCLNFLFTGPIWITSLYLHQLGNT